MYIVDDIVETGDTIRRVIKYLQRKNPKSIHTVVLIKRHQCSFPVEYFCFVTDKKTWLYGYGMDTNGIGRNYRNIYLKK